MFHHTQNFFRRPGLVTELVERTNIAKTDVVYDIGAGLGAITEALAPKCHAVVAVEADEDLAQKLNIRMKRWQNAVVYATDFFTLPLPTTPYKVFSNIPFNRSADIVSKLLHAPNPPEACYLIVQKEFAKKLEGGAGKYNSQLAIELGASFKIQQIKQLRPADFNPRPSVTPVFLEILHRKVPLVPQQDLPLFYDFVAHAFNTFQFSGTTVTPSQLTLAQWVALFAAANQKHGQLVRAVGGYKAKLAKAHEKRIKSHRTSLRRRASVI